MDHKPAEAFHVESIYQNKGTPQTICFLGNLWDKSFIRATIEIICAGFPCQFVILLLDAPDTDENRTRDETVESNCSKDNVKDIPRPGPSTPVDNRKVNWVDSKGQELVSPNSPIDETRSGEVNMEASISQDDIIRAGGFGARDDISSFLPVASDSTDFEATILDARKYEEPQGEIHRPGLGWTEATERK